MLFYYSFKHTCFFINAFFHFTSDFHYHDNVLLAQHIVGMNKKQPERWVGVSEYNTIGRMESAHGENFHNVYPKMSKMKPGVRKSDDMIA